MIRLVWRASSASDWLVPEEEFVSQIEEMALQDFALAPSGGVTVEALDESGRTCWRSYHGAASELLVFARQLSQELQADTTR